MKYNTIRKKISLIFSSILLLFSLPIMLFMSSCSIETWKTNIQFVFSPNSVLADHSFNENAFNGVSNFFKDTVYKDQNWVGPNPNVLIDKTSGIWRSSSGYTYSDYIQTYRDAYASGAAMLVCNGFWQVDPLQLLSCDEELTNYPNWTKKLRDQLGVIYVDGEITNQFQSKNSNPYNVAAIAYKVDDAAFWGGVLTGIELNNNPYYKPVEDDGKYGGYKGKAYLVGGFVGLAIPPTISFLNGWCEGLNFFNSCLDVYNKNKQFKYNPVIFISPNGENKFDDINSFATGSFSPSEERARAMTDSYLEKGVSAILPVAGPQTAIVVKEIAEHQSHTMVIGVDTSLEIDKSVNMWIGDQPIIPFSITKNLAQSIEDVLKKINSQLNSTLQTKSIVNANVGNSYNGFGYNNWATWLNKGVGLSYKYFEGDKIQDRDYIEEIKNYVPHDRLTEQENGIITPKKNNGSELKITGNEFNAVRAATVDTQTVTTIPEIPPAGDLKNNIYNEPGDNNLVANESDIKNFLSAFAKNHSIKENSNKKIDWYMQQN